MTSTRRTARSRPLPRLFLPGPAGATWLARYGLAVTLAACVLTLVRLLNGTLAGVRLSILVGATGIAAFVGGAGPGVVVLLLCVLGLDVLFFEFHAASPLAFSRPVEMARLAIFAGVEVMVISGGAALRRALVLLDAERREATASEERFRLLAENARDIVYRFRLVPTRRFEYVCSATTRLLGYTPEEHYANPELWASRVHPDDLSLLTDETHLSSGLPVVVRVRRKDGEWICLEHRAAALRNEKGEVVAVQGIARDVTQHKRTEQAEELLLEASRLLAESLDAQATVANVVALAARSGFCDLCVVLKRGQNGYDAQRQIVEAVGFSGRLPTDREAVERFALASTMVEGALGQEQMPCELAVLARPLLLEALLVLPLRSRQGDLGTMIFGRHQRRGFDALDLSTGQRLAIRCAMALENAELFARAQRALRQRDDVLAIVSHDLKNPLGAIMLSAGLVERSVRGSEPLRRIEVNAQAIRRAAERMNRLIHDLLDFSALDAGKLAFDWRTWDCNALLRDALEAFTAPAHERFIELELGTSPEPLGVRADRDRLIQVLSNLLGNALAATAPHGKVRLSAQREGHAVRIEVRDTGKGIPAEDLPHVFERFRRGTAGYKGTGLGLAIARALVEAHGGRIWAESRVGEGTTVSVLLPLANGAPASRAPAPAG